jgi:hypothetical protein
MQSETVTELGVITPVSQTWVICSGRCSGPHRTTGMGQGVLEGPKGVARSNNGRSSVTATPPNSFPLLTLSQETATSSPYALRCRS